MGAFVSKSQCASHYGVTLNCNTSDFTWNKTESSEFTNINQFLSVAGIEKGQAPADPDIAGIGVSHVASGMFGLE
jgi:hypothetical protein